MRIGAAHPTFSYVGQARAGQVPAHLQPWAPQQLLAGPPLRCLGLVGSARGHDFHFLQQSHTGLAQPRACCVLLACMAAGSRADLCGLFLPVCFMHLHGGAGTQPCSTWLTRVQGITCVRGRAESGQDGGVRPGDPIAMQLQTRGEGQPVASAPVSTLPSAVCH